MNGSGNMRERFNSQITEALNKASSLLRTASNIVKNVSESTANVVNTGNNIS